MRVLSSIILSVLTCGITPLKINFKTFTGLRGKGYKLSDGFVNQTLDNIHLIPCINTCSTGANCRSVSWNSDNQKCLLGLTDVTSYVEASTQLSNVSGWNTYSLMEYTVFVAKYPHIESHTFDEASQLCIELGTRLASPDDLMYSHSIGFGYSRGTWMSDGTIGYILQDWSEIYYGSISWSPWTLCVLN